MKTVAIITPLNNVVFADLAKALCLSFMEMGWVAMQLGSADQIKEYRGNIDLAIVLTPFDYANIAKLLPNTKRVLYQLETLPWPRRIHLKRRCYWREEQIQELLPQYDAIFDYDMGNINEYWCFYRNNKAIHLPIGYSSAFEYEKRVCRDKRALFIGNMSEHPKCTHRSRTLRAVIGKCHRSANFGIVSNRWGDKVKQSAKKALININIHQSNIPVFEGLRIVALLMSNKCFVITEPCENMQPFEDKVHLAVVKHTDMPGEIKYYLETFWECERMANNAYDFIKKNYTMTQNLQRAIDQL